MEYKMSISSRVLYSVIMFYTLILTIGSPLSIIIEYKNGFSKTEDIKLFIIVFLVMGIFSAIIFIYCLMLLIHYKIIVEEYNIIINGAFGKKIIDLKLYNTFSHIWLLRFPDIIRIKSDNGKNKPVNILCIFKEEETLEKYIQKKLDANKYKWYYEKINENKKNEDSPNFA
ncbi:hypothetical protein FACS189485_16930 [Spirochaetia bacterium]|nr:hypothetical protein FACS189485_16930 [Spirochaetia bacterium]